MSTGLGLSIAAQRSYTRHRGDAATSRDDVTPTPVLIFSSDPLAAALLAAAIELAGHSPYFAQKDERARDALLRVRPRLVLIDCDHEESCSDEFIGPALMVKARILLFRSRRTTRDVAEFSRRLELRVIELPMDYEELSDLLAHALAD